MGSDNDDIASFAVNISRDMELALKKAVTRELDSISVHNKSRRKSKEIRELLCISALRALRVLGQPPTLLNILRMRKTRSK